MTKTADEIMATLPPFLKARFDAIVEGDRPDSQDAHPFTNSGRLSLLALEDDEIEPRPEGEADHKWEGPITPSIYCARGDSIAFWNMNGEVEVVLRDGNGFQHYGKLCSSLVAEGGFAPTDSLEDRAFLRRVYDAVIGPERNQSRDAEGNYKNDTSDFNYTHRATCLWDNRDRKGAPYAHAFLIVSWKGRGRSSFPIHALLLDGDKLREFEIQRELPGGNRPQWKGRAL